MSPVNPEPDIRATDLINPILSAPGSYSDVYKCTLTTGSESTLVAVKFIRFGRHKEYYDRILREIHLRRRLQYHANIIQLLGTTGDFQGGSFPSLVFPWMLSGDLDRYIAYHGTGIEASLKLSLACDIASGVAYLHESHVVHGNLESKNILIGPENRAYLTGFSLATDLDKPFKTPEPGGVRFAAPECFIDKKVNSSFNRDIYSIGCILLHVFSGCLPWHDSRSSDIINRLRQRRMPPRPVGGGINDSLWNFITRCCSFIPRDRPSATQILEFLKYQYKPSEVDISSDDLTEMLCNRPPFHTVSGGFAYITKCTLKRDWNTIQVAAKSIRSQRDVPDQKEYLRERKLWERLVQENILPLLGVTRYFTTIPGCDALVCPWMENGTLSQYIDRYPALELRQKLKLLCDVATGLHYLHSQDIVHGDLTIHNILVDVNGRAVLADFGLSFRVSELTGNYTATQATRWMAPELAVEDPKPSIHSDMYPFGSIMNYVISGELPFASDRMPDTAIYRGKAPCTVRGNDVSPEHWNFIQRCWGHIASSRPSAEEACKLLRSELDSNS